MLNLNTTCVPYPCSSVSVKARPLSTWKRFVPVPVHYVGRFYQEPHKPCWQASTLHAAHHASPPHAAADISHIHLNAAIHDPYRNPRSMMIHDPWWSMRSWWSMIHDVGEYPSVINSVVSSGQLLCVCVWGGIVKVLTCKKHNRSYSTSSTYVPQTAHTYHYTRLAMPKTSRPGRREQVRMMNRKVTLTAITN